MFDVIVGFVIGVVVTVVVPTFFTWAKAEIAKVTAKL